MMENYKYKNNLKIICFLWIILMVFIKLYSVQVDLTNLINVYSIITIIILFFMLYNLIKWKKTFLKITIIFFIMSILFLHGLIIVNAFNLDANSILANKFTRSEILDGIIYAQLYFTFYILGLCFGKSNKDNKTIEKKNEDKLLSRVGFVLLFATIPFEFYVNIKKLSFTLSYGYASNYQSLALNTIPSYIKIISYFFLPACFYILYGSKTKSFSEKISIMMILIHAVLELLIGYRSSAMVPLLLLIYGLNVKNKSDSKTIIKKNKSNIVKLAIIALAVILFIFPVIRSSRNSGGLLNMNSESITDSIKSNDLFTTVEEMGKSMQVIIYTKKLVPNIIPYKYGYPYLIYATLIIPNIFQNRHPAELYGSLGKRLTKIIDPDFYNFGGGLGFSCVAEFYLNFGIIGVILMSFMLGFFLEKVEYNIDLSNNLLDYSSFTIIAIYLLTYPRGEIGDLIRGVFWYMLIPRIIYLLFKKKGSVKNV